MEDATRSQLDEPLPASPEAETPVPTVGSPEPDPVPSSEGSSASALSDPPTVLPDIERRAWPLQLVLKAFLACAVAFIIPGAGHALLGRWIRGLLLFLAVMGMFLAGLFLFGGRLYTFNPEEPLSIFLVIANAGLGGTYALCALSRTGFEADPALRTYEYGNAFLLVAGLLNYLVILDAFDIAIGRKK
ncbi:hypothetical protein HRbin08_00479 [bacterium HR08]|nr:hypothetical protein HRbin08_00479 [bacterium HR08]